MQEALQNISKHSTATVVTITLIKQEVKQGIEQKAEQNNTLELTINDNGKNAQLQPFGQGLLLMQRSGLPDYFMKHWPAHFEAWYTFLNSNRADAVEVALKFALHEDWIDRIVVGVDSVSQLEALVEIEPSTGWPLLLQGRELLDRLSDQ
mgnify:CR=1 FL=1